MGRLQELIDTLHFFVPSESLIETEDEVLFDVL